MASPGPEMTPPGAERIVLSLPRGDFHALAWGDAAGNAAGDAAAPPLLWLHGFPDHPPTAAPLLSLLARTRRVIAPWLRGYAPSPLAGPYDLATLAGDVVALLAQIAGAGRPADLVGHDWGALITYQVCITAPEAVRRAVTLAVPHPLTLQRAIGRPAQLRQSWYALLFQLPGAERIVRARDLALIDRLWRAWSPRLSLDEARRAELHACLAASLPAPLEYYRALLRPLAGYRARVAALAPVIPTPLLQLHGAEDGCILPPREDDARRFRSREREIVPGVGHFLHLEQPAAIAARIAAWLGSPTSAPA